MDPNKPDEQPVEPEIGGDSQAAIGPAYSAGNKWDFTLQNAMLALMAKAPALGGYAIGLGKLGDFLEEGKNWLEIQQLNAKQSIIEDQHLSESQRFELLSDVLEGRLEASEISTQEALADIGSHRTPLQAYREGLPVRTGIDIDWQALKENNISSIPEAIQSVFDAFTNDMGWQKPFSGAREEVQRHMSKYFHLDARNWTARNVFGIAEDSKYDEKALADGSMVSGLNNSVFWNPSEYEWWRAMIGDEWFNRLSGRKIPIPFLVDLHIPFMNPGEAELTAEGVVDPSWYEPSLLNLAALGTLVLNDPLVAGDWAIDDIARITLGRAGGPLAKLYKRGPRVTDPKLVRQYLEDRAIRAGEGTLEGFPQFHEWRNAQVMDDLRRGVDINPDDYASVRALNEEFVEAVNKNAPMEDLRDISSRRTAEIKRVKDSIAPSTMPHYNTMNYLDELRAVNDVEADFLSQAAATTWDEPEELLDLFLRRKNPRTGQAYHREYAEAFRNGDHEKLAEILGDEMTRYQRLIDASDGRTPEQRVLHIESLRQKSAVMSATVRNYNELVNLALRTHDSADSAANFVRATMADMMAGYDRRREAKDLFIIPGRGIVDDVDSLANLHVSDLKDVKTERILQDTKTREYYYEELNTHLTTDVDIKDMNGLRNATQDPYFRSKTATEIGLDYEAARREMVNFAEELNNNPKFHNILDISRRHGVLHTRELALREQLGKMLTVMSSEEPELVYNFSKTVTGQDGTPVGKAFDDFADARFAHHDGLVGQATAKVDETIRKAGEARDELLELANIDPKTSQHIRIMQDRLQALRDDLAKEATADSRVLSPDAKAQNEINRATLKARINKMEQEIESTISDAIYNSDAYWNPANKRAKDKLTRTVNEAKDAAEELATVRANKPLLRDLIDEFTKEYGQIQIDHEALWTAANNGQPATQQQLDLMKEVHDVTRELWDRVLKADPSLAERAGDNRDLYNLVKVMQGSYGGDITGGLTPSNVFNPRRAAGMAPTYDVGEALNFALQAVNRHIHNKPIIDKLDLTSRQMFDLGHTSAGKFYRTIKNRVVGNPVTADDYIDSAWYRSVVSTFKDPHMRNFMLRHELGRPTKLALGFVRGMYIGSLFLNTGYYAKNMAGMINTAALYGRSSTLKNMFKSVFDPDDVRRTAGLTIDLETYYGGSGELDRLSRKAMQGNSFTENILRTTAWYAAKDDVLDTWASEGLIKAPTLQAAKDAGLEGQLVRECLDAAFETQHVYGIMGRPIGPGDMWNSQILRPAQQFINYIGKQTDFGIRRLMEAKSGNVAPLMRWFATTGEMIRIANSAGIDATGFAGALYGQQEFINEAGFHPEGILSPGMQLGWDIFGAAEAYNSGDVDGSMRHWTSAVNLAVNALGGARGLPMATIRRTADFVWRGDAAVVSDAEGDASYYLNDDEKLWKLLGIPTKNTRRRATLHAMRLQDKVRESISKKMVAHEVRSTIAAAFDETGKQTLTAEAKQELQDRIGAILHRHGTVMTSEQINNIVEKGVIPKTFEADFASLDQLGRETYAMINAPFVDSARGQGASQVMLHKIFSKKHTDLLGKLSLKTRGDLYDQVIPRDVQGMLKTMIANAYSISENMIHYVNGQPYVLRSPDSGILDRVDADILGPALATIVKYHGPDAFQQQELPSLEGEE